MYVVSTNDDLLGANAKPQFANLQIGNNSLTHTMPKGRDMYPAQASIYPFPSLRSGDNTSGALLQLLPHDRQDLFDWLEIFSARAQSCSFPHMPDEVSKKEVGRFLDEVESNPASADNNSDMLALIFATIATGMQMGVHDRSGRRWVRGAMKASLSESECYRRFQYGPVHGLANHE
jgi:hypothetical protein